MGNLIETGLGWYLDEDYLLTVGNTLMGTISGGGGPSSFPNQPIPSSSGAAPTAQQIIAGNFPLNTQNPDSANWRYAMSSVDGAYVFTKTPEYIVYGVTPTIATIYHASRRNDNVLESAINNYDSSTGLYYGQVLSGSYYNANLPLFSSIEDALNAILAASSSVTKVQGGAGAFAFISYPHNGDIVHVGVGISSIGIPNSAATVAVDGVNGSYNTFNREDVTFTMFYTGQLSGTLTTDVPEVTLDTDISALPGLYEARLFLAVADAAQIHVGYIPADEDPYSGGGISGPSEGTPDFTEVSESISPGSTFPISFQSTGLCRVYVPSITDLNDLANYLWTDQTFLDTIKNILINQFENFMEAVISLTMVPCQVPAGTAQPVKVMFLPTGLSFPPATQQFVEVDCGYVDITERYASALDYNPYTKVSLYLPFIGTVPLDTDEVMGHRVKCVYTIDIVSGACVAKIMVDYPDFSNGVLYQFSGHCSISMPLTAADFSSYYAAAMSGLKMAAGLAAAGAGAPSLAGSLLGEPTAHPSSTTTTTRTTARNAATGRQILTGTESKEKTHTPGQASFKELATRASVNTVGAVINSKFSVEHSGGFTGNTGFLGVQAPYVIITRPDMCNPNEYGAYNGRPSMMYLYLGNLSGFTQVQNIKLTGIPATNPELGEIAELLKTGVIL